MRDEINTIIKTVSGKKGRGRLDEAKLRSLFNLAGIITPEPSLKSDYALYRIKSAAKAGHSFLSAGFDSIRLRKVAVFALLFMVITAAMVWRFMDSRSFHVIVASSTGHVNVENEMKTSEIITGGEISPGSILTTGKDALAVLETETKGIGRMTIKVGEKSRVAFNRIASKRNSIDFLVTLEKGSVVLNVRKLARGDSVIVRTDGTTAAVKGTIFGVSVMENGDTVYEVLRGKIRMGRRVPEKAGIDPSLTALIDEELEKHSVILEEHQVCSVPENNSIYSNMTRDNYRMSVAPLPEPVVRAIPPQKMVLGRAMQDEEKALSRSDGESVADVPVPDHGKGSVQIERGKNLPIEKLSDKTFMLYSAALNSLILAGSNGYIASTDSNQLEWGLDLRKDITEKPLIDSEFLYALTADGFITAIRLANGTTAWKKKFAALAEKPIRMTLGSRSLYIVTSGREVLCVGKDGNLLWRNMFEEKAGISPVLTDNMVLISDTSGGVTGFDRRNGIKVFKRKFASAVIAAEAVNTRLYLAMEKGPVICYDLKKDEIQWSRDHNERIHPFLLADGGYLYIFSREGKIYKIDDKGESIWTIHVGNAITRDPIYDYRRLYILCDESFYVIKKQNGIILWSIVMPSVLSRNIVLSGNNIYFATSKKGVVILKK